MINDINANPSVWKKKIYIANKVSVSNDEDGNEIPIYGIPNLYEFNCQSVTSDAEISEFGENSKIMKKAVISSSYINQFKEFDVAYLDGATPTNELINGDNANYKLLPPRNGNSVIIIYFEKLTGK